MDTLLFGSDEMSLNEKLVMLKDLIADLETRLRKGGDS